MTAPVRQYPPLAARFSSEGAALPDELHDIAVLMGALLLLEKYMRGLLLLLLIVSSLLVLGVSPAGAHAQLIDVGSGSVRAPFEVAQRRGRLRDRIRSRFRQDEQQPDETEPTTPQQRYPGAIQPLPVPPALPLRGTARPVPPPRDPQSLQTSLIIAEAELERQLSTSSSGDAYRKYLRVGEVSEVLLQTLDTSLTAPGRQRLQQILDVYDRTRIDPRQRWVSRLSGFQSIHTGLSQLLASDAEPQDSRPGHVSVERKLAEPGPLRIPAGEPQPTQVLPAVRDSY